MFSFARPQFIEPPPEPFTKLQELVLPAGKQAGSRAQSSTKLRALAVRPLGPTGQKKNDMLGFFEVGFFIGAGITLSAVLPVVGWGAWVLGRKGLEYAARFRQR